MFNFRIDKKTILIALGVMLVLWLMRNGTTELLDLLYTIPGILIALTFHEYAHAFVADRLRRRYSETSRKTKFKSIKPY